MIDMLVKLFSYIVTVLLSIACLPMVGAESTPIHSSLTNIQKQLEVAGLFIIVDRKKRYFRFRISNSLARKRYYKLLG